MPASLSHIACTFFSPVKLEVKMYEISLNQKQTYFSTNISYKTIYYEKKKIHP